MPTQQSLLTRVLLLIPGACVCLVGLGGCPQSDVGSPCNHGGLVTPSSLTITFPALACDHLMCVYADDAEASPDPCTSDADCNLANTTETRFQCVDGQCELDPTYVLNRSMCSMLCESDADCAGGDPDSTCKTGFSCARPQTLGEHCCKKLCVCNDDLDVAAAAVREEECSAGTHDGCCNQTPMPEACSP